MRYLSTYSQLAAVACGLLLAAAPAQAQFIWYVDDDGQSGNGCTGWVDACPEIQTALDLANPGDQIWVAEGTYRPDYDLVGGTHTGDRTGTFQLLSGVALYGGFDGSELTLANRAGLFDQTILSGDLNGDDGPNFANNVENSYHVVSGNGTNRSAILDGFTITAGNADGNGALGQNAGAGMYNFFGSPTVNRCTFTGNTATRGGGLSNTASSPAVTDCTFIGNNAASSGGGMANGGASGGTVINCVFRENTANRGAGMLIDITAPYPTLINCAFIGNNASVEGGGLAIRGSDPEVINCTFSGNFSGGTDGGGIFNESVFGGGISSPTITNCVLWDNTDFFGNTDESAQIGVLNAAPVINYCTIQGLTGGLGGVGNIGGDPLFADPDGPDNDPNTFDDNDYRLSAGSPCIDAADNTPASLCIDLDRNDRFVDDAGTADTGVGTPPIVDMGSYEFGSSAAVPPGPFVDCNGNGIFDECEPDCDGNGIADSCDIADGTSADCNLNGVPDPCDISSGTSVDVDMDGVPDECVMVAVDATDAGAQALGLALCNVLVQFSDPADSLLSVGFANVVTDDPAGFDQQPLGTDTAPLQIFVDVFPELTSDSYVDIGLKIVPSGVTDGTSTDPDFDFAFQGDPGHMVGGWFNNNPANGQGTPDANLQVFVAQLAIRPGYTTSGSLVAFLNQGDVKIAGAFECVAPPCVADPDCDDGIPCTDDACVMGSCENTPNDGNCADAVACTLDICSLADGGCVNRPSNANCDDGDSCTADICNAMSGCDNSVLPDGTPCDDGDADTTNDECTAGVCEGVPNDFDNDGLVLSVDPCPLDARNLCFGPVAVDLATGNPIRVNANVSAAECAGDKLDCNGDMWFADFGYNDAGTATACNLGGGGEGCVISGISGIFGCEDEETEDIFQCGHEDPATAPELVYSFDVPTGAYVVNLLFANTDTATVNPGSRVFDIFVGGQLVYDDFDQVDAAGGSGTAVVRSAMLTILDGSPLKIEFARLTGDPALKGIEVVAENPRANLTLSAPNRCLALNDQFTVNVDLSNAQDEIVGGQFNLEFDTTALDFVSATPGTAPFTQELIEMVDEAAGSVFYAVGVQAGGTGTSADTTMAVLTFQATAAGCGAADPVRFGPDAPPQQTLLTDEVGTPLAPAMINLPSLTVGGDASAPALNIPADLTINCAVSTDPTNTGQATATDSCDPAPVVSFSDSVAPGICPQESVITRTWTATDACGNNTSADQIITVDDSTAPVVTAPADVTVDCSVDVSDPANTGGSASAADSCDPAPALTFSDSSAGTCPDVITRTWMGTDACGNVGTAVQLITVEDTIAPTVTAPLDVTVDCSVDVSDPANTGGSATATDNCNAAPVVTFADSSSGTCPTVITRTWTATDDCGNVDSAIQIITVEDTTAPAVTPPADLTVDCTVDAGDPANTGGSASANDDCDPAPVVTFSDSVAAGACPAESVITRTWTATDNCGNVATAVQIITVDDATAPTVSAPMDVTVDCSVDASNPANTGGSATATDDCDAAPVVTFSDSSAGSCPDVITRTWTATDACSNVGTAIQIITVQDSTAPLVTAPMDVAVDCSVDINDPANTGGSATATDDCDPAPVVTFLDTSSGACPTIITRTWTATDACGNVGTAIQTITTGDDLTAPTVTAPIDVTVDCSVDVSDPANTAGPATATDDCDPDPTVTFSDSSAETCPDTITRTWSATDDCGNVGTAIQLITVEDSASPVVTAPLDVTVDCGVDISDPANTGGSATVTDDCDVAPVVTFSDSSAGTCPDVITRTWSATDACGNLGTAIQLITLEDTTAPTVTAPLDATVDCSVDVSDPANTGGSASATDDCDPAPVITFTDNSAGTCPDAITRTWSAADACGNVGTAVQLITVDDTAAPTVTAPLDTTVDCSVDVSDPLNTGGSATALDDCDPAPLVTFSDSSAGTCPDTVTRTWTAADACGNVGTAVQLITVQDTTAPTVTAPLDATVDCSVDVGDPLNTGGSATATDDCDPAPLVTFSDSPAGACPDTITRTWTATDACGNIGTAIQLITVQDTTAPTVTAPLAATVDCGVDVSDPANTGGSATATDDCDASPVVSFSDTSAGTCPDTITRTWTATDACGNVGTAIQLITVEDTTAPTVTAPLVATVDCGVDVSDPANTGGSATATDDCDASPVVTFSDASAGTCPDTITRTWSATDACGNVGTAVQLITVEDTTAPTVTAPLAATVECGVDVSDPANTGGSATATDDCDASPVVTFSDTSAGTCPQVITRTWSATDACGNMGTAVQLITVEDTTAPTVTAPLNATVDCSVDVGDPANTGGSATATDDCDPIPAVTFSDSSAGTCPDTISRTWTATDACGNVGTAVQLITVEDTTVPTVTAPLDTTVDCNVDVSDPANTGGSATATDECDASPVVAFSDTSAGTCPETITRTWTATDACGNVGTAVQLITVEDTTAPSATAPLDATVECGVDVSDPANTGGSATAADDCDPAPVVTFSDTSAGSCPEVITRTWTATDACGNVGTAVQLITVEDTTTPTVTAPLDASVDCSVDASDPANTGGVATATDDCDAAAPLVTFSDTSAGTCPEVITRTWSATDVCGNLGTAVQQISVEDATPPLITCPADVLVNADAGGCGTVVDYTVTANDDCGTATVNCDTPSGSVFSGTTTVTCTATDDCGNVSLPCSFEVVVAPVNELLLDVQLSPTVESGPLPRCLTLELSECPGDIVPSATVDVDVTFDFDSGLNTDGVFRGSVLVPCGSYTCMTVRDRLHTLKRSLDAVEGFGISGPSYVADFIAPGKELIGGNLNDDSFIDILDFGVFVGEFGQVPGGSDCMTVAPHADIDGDGIVFTEEFTFISINFLSVADAECCAAGAALVASSDATFGNAGLQDRDGPITRISVRELQHLGLSDLVVGDLNGDGWLDEDDMAAFASGERP